MLRIPLDVELSLLIDCTVPRFVPEVRARAARLLAAGIDENRLYELADRHQLAMLLYRGLVQLGVDSPLRARLEIEMTRSAIYYECVYPRQLAALLDELHAAGVQTLLLKGYALGQSVYQQPVLRPYSDYDILVAPETLEQSIAALTHLGYFPDDSRDYPPDYSLRHHHVVPYIHPEWLPVELHWRLVVPSGALHLDLSSVWAEARVMDVNGAQTFILSPEHLLIYLALHTVSNHLFDIGLRALTDVNEVVCAGALDWERVVETSRMWGCTRQVYLMLRMVEELYDDCVPKSVLSDLCPSGIAPEFVAYCLSNLLKTTVTGLKKSSGLAAVWQTPEPARRWPRMAARLFPPSAEVAAAYDLRADDLRRWLYYPRWQLALIRRHLGNLIRLVEADPVLLERARQEVIRRDLVDWVSKG